MAVFRVEKNHNYTVMSNYHLRDTGLTLKAIGLLSKMLSLTDEWDYTTRGLAAICKEGVDAIGAALKELEARGYLVRRQIRDSKGRITDTEYTIYESPHTPLPDALRRFLHGLVVPHLEGVVGEVVQLRQLEQRDSILLRSRSGLCPALRFAFRFFHIRVPHR